MEDLSPHLFPETSVISKPQKEQEQSLDDDAAGLSYFWLLKDDLEDLDFRITGNLHIDGPPEAGFWDDTIACLLVGDLSWNIKQEYLSIFLSTQNIDS